MHANHCVIVDFHETGVAHCWSYDILCKTKEASEGHMFRHSQSACLRRRDIYDNFLTKCRRNTFTNVSQTDEYYLTEGELILLKNFSAGELFHWRNFVLDKFSAGEITFCCGFTCQQC